MRPDSTPPPIPGVLIGGEKARHYQHVVQSILQQPKIGFPGAQPVSFGRRHLNELQHENYFVCEKTDGIRCLLFCTTDERRRETHFLIDRKNHYYQLFHLHMPAFKDREKHSNGTILDGELVIDTFARGAYSEQHLYYYVFDMLAWEGDRIMDRPFNIRFGKLQIVLDAYKDDQRRYQGAVDYQPFMIKPKKFEFAYSLPTLFKKINDLPHGNDGLIFQKTSAPYTEKTDENIVKWKPPNENTIDFRLRKSGQPDEYDLWVFYGNDRPEQYQRFAALYMDDQDRRILAREGNCENRIIECYRTEQGQWRMKIDEGSGRPRWRDDKNEANHHTIVTKILESIEDGVSTDDLLANNPRVEYYWKERAREEKRKADEEKRRRAQGA